ncbi:transglutaminase-like cysteine peptidase [Teredinibacter franksiae]|uniref:transglutaminase-like cysteine peptidase n=1 Tax=Teredinibacter franksiae TaxID=2761453 RepID=UPI001FE86F2C|nr:transglutaminase-like cysteine peptidase [Teredinibacter franksiae]
MISRSHSIQWYCIALLLCVALVSNGEPYWDKLVDLAEQRYGTKGKHTVGQWRVLLEVNETAQETAKLMQVNDFFNQRVRFNSDIAIWGKKDYWATPLETMGTLQGDCEDFSIAKYVSLLKLGISVDKLRLVYVKAKLNTGRVQAHMVLAYYAKPKAEPLILDNLSTLILPASKRPDLTPVFSFNSAGLWVGNSTEPKVKKPQTRLSRWREVLTRMQLEGIQ